MPLPASHPLGKSDIGRSATVRKRKPLLRLRYVALVIVCGWAATYFLHVERPQLEKLQTQNHQLQVKLSQMKQQQVTLQNEEQHLNTPSYIEKYATEHQNLVLPNQIPFDLQQSGQTG